MKRITTTLLLFSVVFSASAAEPPVTPASQVPLELKGVGFDQRLEAQIDLDLEFTDSDGRQVRLGDLFRGRPVVLSLVYYECPMLCTLELNGLLKALRAMSETPGEDFDLVTVSFDPGETVELAEKKKDEYIKALRKPGAEDSWHFLVGEESSIKPLAEAVGFRYRYDEERDLYRHASGIVTLTPDGRVSRYQFGVEYSARDLKFALMDASEGRIGDLADAVMLYCFHYDPATGKYGFVVMNALRVGGALTLLLLGGFVILNLLRDRRRTQHSAAVS